MAEDEGTGVEEVAGAQHKSLAPATSVQRANPLRMAVNPVRTKSIPCMGKPLVRTLQFRK